MQIVQVARSPRWPLWAMLVLLGWLGLVGAAVLLSSYTGEYVELCLFKRLTGVACPTCGLTRGAISLLHGNIVRAWLYNPLLFLILSLVCIFFAVRLIFGRTVKIHLTRKERIIALVLLALLVVVNWAYVILYVK